MLQTRRPWGWISQRAGEDDHSLSTWGPTDTLGRLIGQKLRDIWGQPVIIDYKAGAGTVIGVDFVAKSAPDGYTLA
jgi:tripartite-type tricarboxylate transporter receptor subunit TctC